MINQNVPPPTRFIFWCLAPFLVVTFLFFLQGLVFFSSVESWIVIFGVEILIACVVMGLYDPARFHVCWRVAGGIVFTLYLWYLVGMVREGQWFGNRMKGPTSVLQALLGMFVLGYPGFMYDAFGRFAWHRDPEHEMNGSKWAELRDARLTALTEVFGKAEDRILTSPSAVYLGGDADVLTFKNHIPGVVYVTEGLIGHSGQLTTDLGEYELMICAPAESDWMPDLLSRLAPYTTLDAATNPGDTLEIRQELPSGSTIAALLCTHFAELKVGEIQGFVLLCIGITEKELEHCHTHGPAEVLALLKANEVYPYTVPDRDSVI